MFQTTTLYHALARGQSLKRLCPSWQAHQRESITPICKRNRVQCFGLSTKGPIAKWVHQPADNAEVSAVYTDLDLAIRTYKKYYMHLYALVAVCSKQIEYKERVELTWIDYLISNSWPPPLWYLHWSRQWNLCFPAKLNYDSGSMLHLQPNCQSSSSFSIRNATNNLRCKSESCRIEFGVNIITVSPSESVVRLQKRHCLSFRQKPSGEFPLRQVCLFYQGKFVPVIFKIGHNDSVKRSIWISHIRSWSPEEYPMNLSLPPLPAGKLR